MDLRICIYDEEIYEKVPDSLSPACQQLPNELQGNFESSKLIWKSKVNLEVQS